MIPPEEILIERLKAPMTVCIAAVCDWWRGSKIILCSDWKGSGILGSSEGHMKIRPLGIEWYCLFSGPEPEALGLYSILKKNFKDTKIDETNIMSTLQSSVEERKNQKSADFVGSKFGISYNDFLSIGKEKFPAKIFEDAFAMIGNILVGADAIIAGFVAGDPFICRISSDGTTSIRDGFTAIGEGSPLARSALLHRGMQEDTPLIPALYSVYEAKN
jgi:20S proteasome alpha/beta subunit